MGDATILSVRIVALQSAVTVFQHGNSFESIINDARVFEDHLLGDRS